MDGLKRKIDDMRKEHDWSQGLRCTGCQIKSDYFESAMSNIMYMNRVGEDPDEYIENLLRGYNHNSIIRNRIK